MDLFQMSMNSISLVTSEGIVFPVEKIECHLFLTRFIYKLPCLSSGFPGGASGKEPACQCSRCWRCGFEA